MSTLNTLQTTVQSGQPTLERIDPARPWMLAEHLVRLQRSFHQRWQQIQAADYSRNVRIETEYQNARNRVLETYQTRCAELETQYQRKRLSADQERQRSEQLAERQRQTELAEAAAQREQARQRADNQWQNRQVELQEIARQRRERLDALDHARQAQWQSGEQRLARLHSHIVQRVQRWGVPANAVDINHTIAAEQGLPPYQAIDAALAEATEAFQRLEMLPAVRFLSERWSVIIGVVASVIAIVPSGSLLGWQDVGWLLGCVATGVVSSWGSHRLARWLARRSVLTRVDGLRAALARARYALLLAREEQARTHNVARQELEHWLAEELHRADVSYEEILQEIERRYQERCSECQTQYQARLQAIQDEWQKTIAHLEQFYPAQIDALRKECQTKVAALDQEHAVQIAQAAQRRMQYVTELQSEWRRIYTALQEQVTELVTSVRQRFVDWNTMAQEAWQPPSQPSTLVPFGSMTISLPSMSDAEWLAGEPLQAAWEIPAVLVVPDCPSLIVEYADQGRAESVALLQTVMLRWMTALPPGKVRFTLIDPWGLGQNFAAFLHLADFDERLIGYRVWTDPEQIRKRLADLSEHVEMVIQKYLRNEYRSIHEYNAQAGEMAEPIHVVVVVGFPEGFTEESARRLASLAASGPACGVFLLMAVDSRMSFPRSFYLEDLEAHAAVLFWQGERFAWKNARLRDWPLSVEAPPEPPLMNAIIQRWGRLAQGANRVEVPFRAVVPDAPRWWKSDSRHGIEVPVGRAGATRYQFLQLGQGTSQHVVVAGKTGSGKSTFFHALITSTAIYYSPSEVVFYLIDFKKGVEFKAYAEHHLPHAQVVAIESEREFGLSVLQKLDEELQRRGELFRQSAVQDIAAYRNQNPHSVLPRILLIIDEFQEFFVKEDNIARDAGLLLDRLVRQGRAFGIHVFLGSQTLSGAYSLARSTLSQMAVRIALQCSEMDAHLILSEDNTAARLLSRPGEAIYNDANGRVEGNHPFQVVWLPDSERIQYLARISDLARAANLTIGRQVVFEGNRPALLAENDEFLAAVRRQCAWDMPVSWLGAAVAIKPPTSITWQRRPGVNLLVAGQDRSLVLGIMAAALAGAYVTTNRHYGVPRCDIVCSDAEERAVWKAGADRIAQCLIWHPHEVGRLLAAWHQELLIRKSEYDHNANSDRAPWFLILDSLSRITPLHRSESELGFTSFAASAESDSLAERFQQLLQEGPAHGMHFLVSCDGYHAFTRACDRASLREFQYRVLLQMSATDSSHFMDSPSAHQLGACRAILYRDDRGESERFRPYGLPVPWELVPADLFEP